MYTDHFNFFQKLLMIIMADVYAEGGDGVLYRVE